MAIEYMTQAGYYRFVAHQDPVVQFGRSTAHVHHHGHPIDKEYYH